MVGDFNTPLLVISRINSLKAVKLSKMNKDCPHQILARMCENKSFRTSLGENVRCHNHFGKRFGRFL